MPKFKVGDHVERIGTLVPELHAKRRGDARYSNPEGIEWFTEYEVNLEKSSDRDVLYPISCGAVYLSVRSPGRSPQSVYSRVPRSRPHLSPSYWHETPRLSAAISVLCRTDRERSCRLQPK